MRIAFFSPLPHADRPVSSGIADYSAALLEHLQKYAEVETFAETPTRFDPAAYDHLVYQLGNNPAHGFVYEMALRHPGVVVLHEANLHYLVAHLTLNRGLGEDYWNEVLHNGGSQGEHPDYRIPMLRTILEHSRAALVHSEAVERSLRAHDFTKPVSRIPHGAWIEDDLAPVRKNFRARLGLSDENILFGVFGFLKPYKRIREILRAFRRLLQIQPNVRLLLVGERHPELTLDLPAEARHIEFVPIDEFNGYMAACDAVLNLRHPTVGESSGTLMRAFGMGLAAVVSDNGSFKELPPNVCLKIAVDQEEDEYLFAYMQLLASRSEVRAALGSNAKTWVERECSWPIVAERYAEFLRNYQLDPLPVLPEGNQARYIETHRTRLEKILSITPPGTANDWVLEMGAYMHITPALHARLGYGTVRGSYLGPVGKVEVRTAPLADGETFECRIDHFDAEKDFFPYPSAHFLTVLCCELLEHLQHDPMFMMDQIHRILRPGGHLVITTPNIAALRSAAAVLQGHHPMLFPAYFKPVGELAGEPRHAREYTPDEIRKLFEAAGFEVVHLSTGPFRDEIKPEHAWVEHILDKYMLSREHRGEGIYAVGKKVGPLRERYPAWLYA